MKLLILSFVTLLSLAFAKAAVFPVPDTPYRVKWTSEELVDHDRVDPFNSTHPRRLMISRFTPLPPRKCKKSCQAQYMTPLVSEDMEAAFGGYLGPDWPGNVFNSLKMDVCCKGSCPECEFPLVLLGSGLAASRMLFSVLAQNIAGMGYEVVVMDHPYETNVVEFPDGSIIRGGRIGIDDETGSFGVEVRAADATFVLDTIGTGKYDKVVMIGMSYGGAAAAASILHDSRIVGGVNLDGRMYGSALELGVDKPFILFGSSTHNSTSLELDDSWAKFWNTLETKQPDAWIKELSLAKSAHASFNDASSIGDVTGLRSNALLRQLAFGDIAGDRVMKILREYLSDFIEYALGQAGEGLLAGPSPQYPEVTFFRVS
ncbi:putative 1-alkyl-2-acetylglycerophosphocholine esterase [Paramyrothecium foliicola]|nr:putative 1-alkyl-2-acetylglycerophosphocholine esterase [Paramyrothecium foliicola]